MENSVDPDQTPQNAASDQGLHCLLRMKTSSFIMGKGLLSNIDKKSIYLCTDIPLYTDTRYNDKIRYSDNLIVTKPSLKR